MKIYKIWQNVSSNDYDTYDSAIVCAESEDEATKFHPDGSYEYKEDFVYDTDDRYNTEEYKKRDSFLGSWIKRKYVKVEEIGEANDNQKKGVIVASYNAG